MTTPRRLEAWIDGIGVIGPGLASWPTAASVLVGETPFEAVAPVLTLPPVLPPAERRRTGVAVKVALISGHEAVAASGHDGATLASVFTSSGGDGDNCHAICEALASDDRLISPTRFHNSVHNAPAGYWSIAMGARAASTSLCAHDASFAAGLLEAVTDLVIGQRPVILVAYDAPYPSPLQQKRPVPWPLGLALVLSPTPASGSLGRITAAIGDAPSTRMAEPALEALRATVPTARALPLLEAVARRRATTVHLDYLAPMTLRVEIDAARGVR